MPEEYISKKNDYLATLDTDLEGLINAAFVQEVAHTSSLEHGRQRREQTNRLGQATPRIGERQSSKVINLITAKKILR